MQGVAQSDTNPPDSVAGLTGKNGTAGKVGKRQGNTFEGLAGKRGEVEGERRDGRQRHITLQAHTAVAAALLCHRQRAGVQPIGRAVQARADGLFPPTKQPKAALVCRLMVSASVIYVIIWIVTHLPILKGWKTELAWLVDP